MFCALWAAIVLVVFSLARGQGRLLHPARLPAARAAHRALPRAAPVRAAPRRPTITLARAGLWAVVGARALLPPAAITAGARAYGGALLRPSLWSLLLLVRRAALAALLLRGTACGRRCSPSAGVARRPPAGRRSSSSRPPLMEVHSDAPLARALQTLAPDHADGPAGRVPRAERLAALLPGAAGAAAREPAAAPAACSARIRWSSS